MCKSCATYQALITSEPRICRGNEDSHGNENRKWRKKIFSVEKQIDKHTFFNHDVNEFELVAGKIDRSALMEMTCNMQCATCLKGQLI